MQLHERDHQLDFEYSWFKIKYFAALLLTPLFAIFLIESDATVGSLQSLNTANIFILVICLGIVYYSLARLINTTKITVSHHHIEVKHGPLPLVKNLSLDRKDVSQLYVTKHRTAHRYYLYNTTYQINVILANKDTIALIKGLTTLEQGRFIEHRIEDFFDITDVPIEGEIKKD
jgi:hypothetical protein